MIYFNEIDPVACAVLREMYPGATVDERSIKDIDVGDATSRWVTQQPESSRIESRRLARSDVCSICHWFAGAGLWEIARQMAGWPDDRPLWTASCPCQPFSGAGKRLGTDDPRQLWPDLFRLIVAVRPPCIVGEQVSGKAGYGWLDGVCADLEGEGYTVRALDIPALAVNSPQKRNRLWWIALGGSERGGCDGAWVSNGKWQEVFELTGANGREPFWSDSYWLQCSDGKARRAKPGLRLLVDGMAGRADLWRLAGNSIVPQLAAEVLSSLMESMLF